MGRKNVIEGFKAFDAINLATASTVSQSINVLTLDKASLHIKWTGTFPVGVITIQAKNGPNDTFYDLDFGSAINITGNSGEHQIMFNEMPFSELTVTYTKTSGTGTMSGFFTAKVTGA